MKIDRRSFLAGSTALALPSWTSPAAAATVLRPEEFGARGDGITDDTAALQRCLSTAPPGAIVQLRRGAVYRIDTNFEPTAGEWGGIKLTHRQILQLNGAELKALPSRHIRGAVIQSRQAHGWRIEGPGRITGERDIHLGKGGEWGMGIAVFGSRDWTIAPGVEITNCWGDGLYLGYTPDGSDFCENFVIDAVHIWDCRRCGIAISAGRNGEIRNPHIHKIDGTAPAAGIDIEADIASHADAARLSNHNIRITGGRIYEVQIGVDIAQANEDILVSGMTIEADNSGIIIAQNAHRVNIVDNPSVRSTVGGREGAALRTVVYDHSRSVSDVRIENNNFFGGGHFVLDVVGDDYRNFVVTGNRLHATHPGVLGVARLGRVTFVGNRCVMEPASGRDGHFFLYAGHTTHGNNVYVNRTRFGMHSILVRTRDLGGDRYEGPRLSRLVEPG